jgi:hypothetical protein
MKTITSNPDPKLIKIFYEPKNRLRMTLGEDRSFPTVKPAWSAPLSHPDTFLALLDGKGEEIVTLEDPKKLSRESQDAVNEEIRKRYLTATVVAIKSAKQEFGATYWHMITDRGPKDMVTQNLQENAVWLSDKHLLLLDVDGNRFEVPDTDDLDPSSLKMLEAIL